MTKSPSLRVCVAPDRMANAHIDRITRTSPAYDRLVLHRDLDALATKLRQAGRDVRTAGFGLLKTGLYRALTDDTGCPVLYVTPDPVTADLLADIRDRSDYKEHTAVTVDLPSDTAVALLRNPSSLKARILRRADTITVHHPLLAQALAEPPYRLSNVHAVPHTLPETPVRMPEPGQPLRLLWCGHIDKGNNLQPLIHAVAKLPGVTLTVIGHGPGRYAMPPVRLSRNLGLDKRLIWTGTDPMPSDTLLNQADAAVITAPCVNDDTLWLAARYRAAGLPVIAAAPDAPYIPPHASSDGLTVGDSSNPDSWLRAIQSLL